MVPCDGGIRTKRDAAFIRHRGIRSSYWNDPRMLSMTNRMTWRAWNGDRR